MYTRHSVTKNKKKIFKTLALTRKILLSFAKGAKDVLYNSETPELFNPFCYWQRGWTLEDKIWAKRAQAKRALRQLKEKKFIEVRKQGNEIVYRLTEKGRVAVLKDMVRSAGKRKDSKLILISFDIPEQERSVRARLRHLLKDLEFKRVQHSLWASELDIGNIIACVIADIRADKWIKVFESNEIKKR